MPGDGLEPFQGESNLYGRYLLGTYDNAQFRTLGGTWKTPGASDRKSFESPSDYQIRYFNTGSGFNYGFFCVAAPRQRNCTPPTP